MIGCKSNAKPKKKRLCVQVCARTRSTHKGFYQWGWVLWCMPGKGCEKHQRHFQAHSTALLFRMFCKGHPAIAPIVTEYIYRKMWPFFASKPYLRWERCYLTDLPHYKYAQMCTASHMPDNGHTCTQILCQFCVLGYAWNVKYALYRSKDCFKFLQNFLFTPVC